MNCHFMCCHRHSVRCRPYKDRIVAGQCPTSIDASTRPVNSEQLSRSSTVAGRPIEVVRAAPEIVPASENGQWASAHSFDPCRLLSTPKGISTALRAPRSSEDRTGISESAGTTFEPAGHSNHEVSCGPLMPPATSTMATPPLMAGTPAVMLDPAAISFHVWRTAPATCCLPEAALYVVREEPSSVHSRAVSPAV